MRIVDGLRAEMEEYRREHGARWVSAYTKDMGASALESLVGRKKLLATASQVGGSSARRALQQAVSHARKRRETLNRTAVGNRTHRALLVEMRMKLLGSAR